MMWASMNQRECGVDICKDPVDIDDFVDEGVSKEELVKRAKIREAKMIPTDSDIDMEACGEPPGIDDDDEIDAEID